MNSERNTQGEPSRFPSEPQNWVEVGEVVGAVGVSQAVKVRTTDAQPDWLTRTERLWILPAEGKSNRKLIPQWITLKSADVFEDFKVTLDVLEWQSPEAVNAWVAAKLYIEKAMLPPITEAFTFRTFELVGLNVSTEANPTPLAVVTAIVSATHAGDQNFIELTMLQSQKITLIPFESHFVKEVRLSEKCLLLKGLDDFLAEENALPEPTTKKLTPYAKRKLKRQAQKDASAL